MKSSNQVNDTPVTCDNPHCGQRRLFIEMVLVVRLLALLYYRESLHFIQPFSLTFAALPSLPILVSGRRRVFLYIRPAPWANVVRICFLTRGACLSAELFDLAQVCLCFRGFFCSRRLARQRSLRVRVAQW